MHFRRDRTVHLAVIADKDAGFIRQVLRAVPLVDREQASGDPVDQAVEPRAVLAHIFPDNRLHRRCGLRPARSQGDHGPRGRFCELDPAYMRCLLPFQYADDLDLYHARSKAR